MKITLGGQHVDAYRDISWHMTTGVNPYRTVLEVESQEAAFFLGKIGVPLKLVFEDQKTLTVDYVFILGEIPATTPFTRAFLLSDRRWRWSRKHILRRFNIRRKLGDRRLDREGGFVPVEVAQSIDEYYLAPFSTDNGTRWTAKRVIEDIMDEILGYVDPLPYVFRGKLGTASISINDLEINDPAPQALGLAIKAIPGLDCYVDLTGTLIFFNTLDGSEADVVASAGPPVEGSGFPKKISLSDISPSEIDVYFMREIEVRFDALTEGGSVITFDTVRSLENVLPVTDPALIVQGKTVANGTWVNFERLLEAWNANKDPGGDDKPRPDMTLQLIREGYLPGGARWYNRFTLYGTQLVDPIWVGRLEAVRSHFRRTYRINRHWMDRTHSLKANRASLIDLPTGTRALARAYTDYCVIPSLRGRNIDPNARLLGINYFGYNTFLKDAHISPAYVRILDDQVGIIHLDYQRDFRGVADNIIPSAVKNMPTSDMGRSDLSQTWGEYSQDGSKLPALYTVHGCSIVLTMVPGSPNGLGQMHKETITPSDVQNIVPNLTPAGASGPRWELFVGPEVLVARVGWDDDSVSLIEKAFDGEADRNKPVDLSAITLNGSDLKEVAKAVAAAVWKRFQTRVLGDKAVRLNPDLPITGAITDIEHGVDIKGRAITKIRLAEELSAIDPLSLLPASVRAMIFREVPS